MRLANDKDILNLSNLRVIQQKDDWKEKFEDKFELHNRTKEYLYQHLNKDLFMFIEEEKNQIIATCGLQIIEYLPQCNDNGKQGYIYNVYTNLKYRNQGIQTSLLKKQLSLLKKKIYVK